MKKERESICTQMLFKIVCYVPGEDPVWNTNNIRNLECAIFSGENSHSENNVPGQLS